MDYKDIKIIPLTTKSPPDYASDISSIIKFPNLTMGYKCDSLYATKTGRHTRYTPTEWFQKQAKYCNEADSCIHFSERLRNKALQLIRDAEEKVQSEQYNTDRRLGERINDVNFWQNEIASELERLLQEIKKLQDCCSVLSNAIKDTEGPLQIAEECLYHREARKGIELVHDNLEKCLFREITILNRSKKELEVFLDKCKNQLRDCRASQCRLELDLKNKENALGIDTMCHRLNNYSHRLQYYSGIEKYDPCFSEIDTWMSDTNQTVAKSQTERNKSCQLRINAETLVTKIAQEIWDAWNNTNNALVYRSSELLEAKNKLQQHIQKVQQEIFDVEKNLELMHKAIADKSRVLKVTHTRLKIRMHRQGIELCRDYAHTSLLKEIDEINCQIERLHGILKKLEDQYQMLLRTQTLLEHDLMLKIDAIHIDREKVSGLRRAYPINVLFKI